jgi:EAL domain-containing protein (putative c-di-GMP-specific phosphodiesterase class I)
MEALVRWRHPTHGLVAPSRFIHSAEEAGIIHEISRWVLETGCAQMAAWRRQFPELSLTANLSPRDFEHPDLADTVSRVLARHGLPPASLELEVSESLLCSDVQHVAPCLKDLRDLGVGISLDDFGTGYSSLASLQRYGVSRLKIDRSFVKDIQAQASQPVIGAIAGVARGLGIRLAAEGVERGEQRTALEGLGCDEMQGFLFSRPRRRRRRPAARRLPPLPPRHKRLTAGRSTIAFAASRRRHTGRLDFPIAQSSRRPPWESFASSSPTPRARMQRASSPNTSTRACSSSGATRSPAAWATNPPCGPHRRAAAVATASPSIAAAATPCPSSPTRPANEPGRLHGRP